MPIAVPKATRNAVVWLSAKTLPPKYPSNAAYVAQIVAAIAVQNMNHRRGWWVMPDVSVSTVRPPGMKRAVINSIPPRRRICVVAQTNRAWRLGCARPDVGTSRSSDRRSCRRGCRR